MEKKFDNKNIIILLLSIAVLGLGYIVFQQKSKRAKMTPAELMPLESKQQGRRPMSSYEMNQVKNTITKSSPKIQECYSKYLETNPAVTDGKAFLDWNILKDGKVENPQLISTDFQEPNFQTCMTNTLTSITFPEIPEGRKVYISHTFNFKKASKQSVEKPKK